MKMIEIRQLQLKNEQTIYKQVDTRTTNTASALVLRQKPKTFQPKLYSTLHIWMMSCIKFHLFLLFHPCK